MIEWQSAKSNVQIPFIDGKALASTIDPLKEAESWARRLIEDIYEDTEIIIILGVGAGYHIDSLLTKTNIKIVAIDFHADFILSKKSNKEIKYILVEENNCYALKNIMTDLHQKNSQVFLHGPSINPLRSSYFLLRDTINLRTETSIKDFECNDGEIKHITNIKLFVSDTGYVDLNKTISLLEKNNQKNIFIWKVLGEILK